MKVMAFFCMISMVSMEVGLVGLVGLVGFIVASIVPILQPPPWHQVYISTE